MDVVGTMLIGAMSNVISDTGAWIVRCVATRRGRPSEHDQAVAAWFDSYELSRDLLNDVSLPEGVSNERASTWITGSETQSVFRELITVELANASSAELVRVRKNFHYSFLDAFPDLDRDSAMLFLDALFDAASYEMKQIVGRLESADPEFQARVRDEAQSGRIAAHLEAIVRHNDSHAELTAEDRVRARDYLVRYRQIAASEHGSLEPPDFEQRRRIPIQDLYVVPRITLDVHGIPAEEVRRIGSSLEVDLWKLGVQVDRAVLLGDPGGGKSTAMNALINHLASDLSRRIPFLVVLREYAKEDPPTQSIVGYLEQRLEVHYQCPAPSGLVQRLLFSGKAMVFFDGLDELVDTTRRREVTQIVENFSRHYPQTSVLVTSRRIGYEQAQLDPGQFATFQLSSFSDAQTVEYARKWFSQGRRISDQEAEEWARSFEQESAGIPDLRSNPLMLALLCILYRGEGSLPRNRPAVYERCSTLLFETWDSSRKIYVNLRARDLIEPVLRHLAHWLLVREVPSPVVTEEQLVNETARYLQNRRYEDISEAMQAAREFVEFCKGRAWVFTEIGTSAEGEPFFTFSHRTFLEYFAAAYLASTCDTPERLASALGPRIVKQEWDVIAELALQIKSRQIQDGAARFYTALLSSRKYTSIASLGNLTSFLARCLDFVDVPPAITRDLVDRSLEYIIRNPHDDVQLVPLSWLTQIRRVRDTVSTRLMDQISQLIQRGEPGESFTAIHLIISFHNVLLATMNAFSVAVVSGQIEYWEDQARGLAAANREQILTCGRLDRSILMGSYFRRWISLRDLDGWPNNPWDFLFDGRQGGGIGNGSWIDPASFIVRNFVFRPQDQDLDWNEKQLIEILQLVTALGSPPWPIDARRYNPFGLVDHGINPDPSSVRTSDPDARAAALILVAIFHEHDSRGADVSILGVNTRNPEIDLLLPLIPYIRKRGRKDEEGSPAVLPALGIAGKFQEMFNYWASGELTFSRLTE